MTENQQNIPQKKSSAFKGLFSYKWVLNNLMFFLFLALLAVLYIANGHMADKIVRDINTTAHDVKELQYEYKTLKSEEMFKSRESEVVQAAGALGLKLNTMPPMSLKPDNKNDK
jgi:hypothetical protein